MRSRTGRLLPGIVLLFSGAIVSRIFGPIIGINHLLLAILVGFGVANTIGIPRVAKPGVTTHEIWLGVGIILMGSSLSLHTILEAGGSILFLVVTISIFTLLFVELVARTIFGLADRQGSLLAAGSSICGVSAIIAVAGAISAREDQIAYAAATVLLFDGITIVVYPVIADTLSLSGIVFGIWAGISMFSTGPVVAVGFAHSETAGQWATITKLSRNALIGLIIVGYTSYYTKTGTEDTLSVRVLWNGFPKFVLGFLALALVASAGIFSTTQLASIENAYNWVFLLAFVGLGTEIRYSTLRKVGLKPVITVLIGLITSSLVSLAITTHVFG